MSDTPDMTPYIDLRVYDRDIQAIVDSAIQDLELKLPEWQPREDNTEVMLLEAMALEVSEAMFAINRLPGAIMVALMKLYGIERDEGAYPTAKILITTVDTFGYEIPANTQFLAELTEGYDPVVFSTDVAVNIPAGLNSIEVMATGSRFTTEANGLSAETTRLELLDALAYVESADIVGTITSGRDAESDMDWTSRGSTRLRRLSDVLVTPEHFRNTVLEDPAVTRAVGIDLYNPDGVTPANSPGHISIAAYGNGTTLTDPKKAELKAYLQDRAIANLTVHIIDPTITTVNIAVKVKTSLGYTSVEVTDAIRSACAEYLNPNMWPWVGIVRTNEIIALVENMEGVDYTVAVTSPATNLTLTGIAPLVRLGTTTVTFE